MPAVIVGTAATIADDVGCLVRSVPGVRRLHRAVDVGEFSPDDVSITQTEGRVRVGIEIDIDGLVPAEEVARRIEGAVTTFLAYLSYPPFPEIEISIRPVSRG